MTYEQGQLLLEQVADLQTWCNVALHWHVGLVVGVGFLVFLAAWNVMRR